MTVLESEKTNDFFCSIESRQHQEQALGSAPRADVWFMLEYSGRWGAKAFDDSSLDADLKAKVNQQLAAIPNARMMLIKRSQPQKDGIHFYAAAAAAERPTLYHFKLDDYADLAELDLAALAAAGDQYASHIVHEPLILVCTNGLRDRCCALNGVKAFEEISDEFGEIVWQSSHHGGHRFSANMLCMPHGLSYGRADLGEGPAAVRAYLGGKVHFGELRGRSSYDKVAQAAEILLRQAAGQMALDAYRLTGSQDLGDNRWQVNFAENGVDHQVTLQRRQSAEEILVSCDGEKTSPLFEYELIEHSSG